MCMGSSQVHGMPRENIGDDEPMGNLAEEARTFGLLGPQRGLEDREDSLRAHFVASATNASDSFFIVASARALAAAIGSPSAMGSRTSK
jgi:hypothetical protein